MWLPEPPDRLPSGSKFSRWNREVFSVVAVGDGSPEQFEPILQRSSWWEGSPPRINARFWISSTGTFEHHPEADRSGAPAAIARDFPAPLRELPNRWQRCRLDPYRRAEARKIFEPAAPQAEMSDLLWSNGFTSEASPALLGVVGISPKALACLREIRVPEEQGPFEPAVLSSRLGSLEFDKPEISKISESNDLCSDGAQEQAQASQELMTTGHRVFDIVEERSTRPPFGDGRKNE